MNPRAIRHLILAGDFGWIVFSAVAAYLLRTHAPWDLAHAQVALRETVFLMSCAGVAWFFIFRHLKLDGFYGGYEASAMLSSLFMGIASLVVVLASLGFLFRHDPSRLLLLTFAVLFLGAAFLGRIATRGLSRKFAASGRRHRVLILGNGKLAEELAARIQHHPEMRWELVGFLFPSACDLLDQTLQPGRTAQLNSLKIDALLRERSVDEVVLTSPVPDQGEMLNLVANCRRRNIRVSIIPNYYQLYVNRPLLIDLDGLPLLRLGEGRFTWMQSALKRTMDLILSSGLLVLTSPLLLMAMLCLRLQKGKALTSEMRCGRAGRTFRMYRLNSAREGLAASRAERLLETLSITELPQLWNVLVGEMSMVGPRPETEERVKRYSEWQRQRLNSKPGVTGLAQVHGLREHSASEDKAYYDLRYIQDWSLLADLSLILQTLWIIPRRLRSKTAEAMVDAPRVSSEASSEFAELVHVDRS